MCCWVTSPQFKYIVCNTITMLKSSTGKPLIKNNRKFNNNDSNKFIEDLTNQKYNMTLFRLFGLNCVVPCETIYFTMT